jgi:DNA-binding response OmpR family regulator
VLVGARLSADTALVEGLRLREYDVVGAATTADALRAFSCHSFELVLVDSQLGREEGVELIPAVRGLAGVEELPVVLVDDRPKDSRRRTARKLGAAGYLGHPVDLSRVEAGFDRLVRSPARRRFSRFSRSLAVRGAGATGAAHTATLGRLGMFVCTERESDAGAVERYEVALPELSTTIRVEAKTLYERPTSAAALGGRGVRFHTFQHGAEELWIRYLRMLGS